MSDQPTPLAVYRHYKGDLYVVIANARLSEDRDVEVVVYRSCARKTVWVRPLATWNETVERNGTRVPRFVLVDGQGESDEPQAKRGTP